MQLKGSKTEQNLKGGFASEPQASRRYLYFAQTDSAGAPSPGTRSPAVDHRQENHHAYPHS